MCLYTQLIRNKKYIKNEKNGGNPPPITDPSTLYVPIKCGNCIECRAQKARDWQVRLLEEIKHTPNGAFITLTFNTKSLKELSATTDTEGYTRDNYIATIATRRFLERWRKKHKKSLRHWLITELGHKNTEHMHLHGIIWFENKEDILQLDNYWQYGYTWKGAKTEKKNIPVSYDNYVNETTIAYIVKYITKIDTQHKYYKPIILSSPGIGKQYIQTPQAARNKYNYEQTIETYRTTTGHEIMLPQYYKEKLYTERQREEMWLNKIQKNEKYVLGQKATTKEEYIQLLQQAKKKNKRLKFGSNKIDLHKKEQEIRLRIQKQNERLCMPPAGPPGGASGGPSGRG